MSEIWRDIPGLEGQYQASSLGRVRSLDRELFTVNQFGECVKRLKGRVLQPAPNSSGYLSTRIGGKSVSVHRAVCLAFHGLPTSEQSDAAHRDDVRTNNTPENLYWATRVQNTHDKIRNGRHFQANQTHCKRGHEFTEANTFRSPAGRVCRACKRDYYRTYRKAKANAAK